MVRTASLRRLALGAVVALVAGRAAADVPAPVLQNIFPAGGQAGTTVVTTVAGAALDEPTTLRFSDSRVVCQSTGKGQFKVVLPADLPVGVHDVRVVGQHGVSGPRAFFVGNRPESAESEPNDGSQAANVVTIDGAGGQFVNGRLDKPGDIDCWQFKAQAGRWVVIDLWAERLDSPLRGVLEIYDSTGRRLAVDRGGWRVDPRIDFRVPADGTYIVKLFEQTYLGGPDFVYRLDVDAGPRVELSTPGVVSTGESATATLWGRNLSPEGSAVAATALDFDRIDVQLPKAFASRILSPRGATQALRSGFTYLHPGTSVPLVIDVTDVPVVVDGPDNHDPQHAQQIAVGCEVSGRLAAGDEQDWYSFAAHRGEVVWIEGFGARIGSPVDLELTVLDAQRRELARYTDQLSNAGGQRFPTAHVDPEGRFVAPADGSYWLVVRNVTGGLAVQPRRVYRLSVRREEPDFDLVIIPRRADVVTGINVGQGGRELADVLALRRRGMQEPIRLTADQLPIGIECPDTWIAAGEDRGIVVLSAQLDAPSGVHDIRWKGMAQSASNLLIRDVRGGTLVAAGLPTAWARMTQDTPVGVGPQAALLVTATPSATTVFQGGVFDVQVEVQRRAGADGAINLRAVGLPKSVAEPLATIPAGHSRGWLSIVLPETVREGPLTLAIQADTTTNDGRAKSSVTTFSNPVTVLLEAGRIKVTLDPNNPRKIARGEVIHVRYKAERQLGFLGKIHTELAAPGGVVGIRGRGVTFTSQTETGEIQVIATENAPLGKLQFLRLEAVGTVEDQPIYRAGCPLELEITP